MIISWAGQKGGAGKSTLAIATAAEFHRLGYRTLLVDADVQGTAATWGAVAMENAEEQGEEGEAYTFPTVITMRENLHLQLPGIAAGFDVTIIDCPGRIDSMQRAALLVSDMALIPVTPDTSDVWALHGTLELIDQARRRHRTLDARLVINKIRAGTLEAGSARELLEPTDIPILETTIGQRMTYGRYSGFGLGVVEYEPAGKAAEEIQSLVQEIIKIRSENE